MGEYSKPHLPYDQQLSLMAQRGMTYSDRGRVLRTLKRIGYYRLSAYSYPFRDPIDKRQPNGALEGRADNFIAGTSFEQVNALYEFDRKLRSCLATALETLELGLAVHIGYVAGKRSPFAHLSPQFLDSDECGKPSRESVHQDVHEAWLARYEKHRLEAKNEDYVKHFTINYESKLPIWVATEILSFGSLVRLFSLLDKADRTTIASALGVKNGNVLHGWLLSLNVLRNHCAHHGRVWNRVLAYPPGRLPSAVVQDDVKHLASIDDVGRGKLYFMAALLAYFVIRIDPDSHWPRTFRSLLKKFPAVQGITPENAMGFPAGWADQPIWNYAPEKASRPLK